MTKTFFCSIEPIDSPNEVTRKVISTGAVRRGAVRLRRRKIPTPSLALFLPTASGLHDSGVVLPAATAQGHLQR